MLRPAHDNCFLQDPPHNRSSNMFYPTKFWLGIQNSGGQMTHFRSRKTLRLRHYNYASIGIYFVTIREETGVTISIIIRNYKAAVTRQLQHPTWQHSYWERVIRNERELALTREYIANNPAQWGTDKAEDY
ncbi:hypothetical protein E5C26_14870 [Serratia proteamaculans]|uniref:hypothetical protein n=1 Tax=Serratia proteamaculans TaxID=28151 RepID=UPI0010769993|nr:hypothetical protein [Serratia proteamaculans]TFZ50428.1 hypothetical protein E5C26_14870 [Serratia proteamaculans]